MPVAAHGERGGADRAPEIEGKNLRCRIAAELEGDQGSALAGAGWPDDERVPDVADMERQSEQRRAFGFGEQERRAAEMLVSLGPGPHGRERDHVREIERRDRRLADVGVDVTGQAPEPGLGRVDALRDASEIASLNHLLNEA